MAHANNLTLRQLLDAMLPLAYENITFSSYMQTEVFYRALLTCKTATRLASSSYAASDETKRAMQASVLTQGVLALVAYVHEAGSRIYGKYDSRVDLSPQDVSTVIAIRRFLVQRLLLPFDTRCKDYAATTTYESQGHCIESCAEQMSLRG